MLALKPNCMCCDADIAPQTTAYICTFECTFCAGCAGKLAACPGCGGEIVERPKRTAAMLQKYPASNERAPVYENCVER
jgi:uncharacterized protein